MLLSFFFADFDFARRCYIHPTKWNSRNDDMRNACQPPLYPEEVVQHRNNMHAVLQSWDETNRSTTVANNADSQMRFLERHAVGHMR
jgi:hypothetical protein